MLPELLKERFKMKSHQQSRDLPVYQLIVAPGGAKLQEVNEPAPANPTPAPASEPGNRPRRIP
jgi:uncharacterized protein (TIGR03435 family)